MRKKNKIFLLDKFPYILFGIILIFSLIVFLPIRSCMPLNFFSGVQEETEGKLEYTLLITKPTKGQAFNFINQNETVPVEIKAKEVESTNYTIKVLVNDNEIKSFTSPPYEYNWNPGSSGEYKMTAQLIDDNGNIITNSNTVNFTVQYKIETAENIALSDDEIEEKKNEILSQSLFRAQNTIPTGVPLFSYKCYIPPVIDGSIQEWDKFESFSAFEPTFKIMEEMIIPPNDLSGTFYSCWDDDNFYFAIQVVDILFSQNYTGNQINKGDSVILVFDTELTEDMQISFYNSDDYQIDFSPGNLSGISAESFMKWSLNAPPRGVVVKSTILTNMYMIEASIPWYNFPNYTPSDEDVLGFTTSILDTDNLESTELIISSSKTFKFNNVSILGAIALIDAGDIQSSEEESATEGANKNAD